MLIVEKSIINTDNTVVIKGLVYKYSLWLHILLNCFNCPTLAREFQGFRVWGKFVFRTLELTDTPTNLATFPHDKHHDDVIMSAMASQITGLTIVYSIVYSGADQRKHQSSASLAFAGNAPVTGEFPIQRTSNAENVSIWWRHHDVALFISSYPVISAELQATEKTRL